MIDFLMFYKKIYYLFCVSNIINGIYYFKYKIKYGSEKKFDV